MTWRNKIKRILKLKRKEIRCGSNIDACHFRYLLNKAISKKKNIVLNKESLIVKC